VARSILYHAGLLFCIIRLPIPKISSHQAFGVGSSRHRRRRNVLHVIALAPLLNPGGQRCGVEGGGEGVALTDIAANFMQSSPACHRLDAFGHYLHIEFVPKLHACTTRAMSRLLSLSHTNSLSIFNSKRRK
jgi:hypothetical protein